MAQPGSPAAGTGGVTCYSWGSSRQYGPRTFNLPPKAVWAETVQRRGREIAHVGPESSVLGPWREGHWEVSEKPGWLEAPTQLSGPSGHAADCRRVTRQRSLREVSKQRRDHVSKLGRGFCSPPGHLGKTELAREFTRTHSSGRARTDQFSPRGQGELCPE